MKIWDVQNDKNEWTLSHPFEVFHVTFSPDDTLIAASGSNTVWIWDWKKNTCICKLDQEKWCEQTYFTPDGKQVVTQVTNYPDGNAVKVWDLQTKECIRTFPMECLLAIDINSDGSLILVADSNSLSLWDWKQDKVVHHIALESWRWIRAAKFHPVLPVVAVTCDTDSEGKVQIFDFKGKCVGTISHGNQITDLAFSDDGNLLATAGLGYTFKEASVKGPFLGTYTLVSSSVKIWRFKEKINLEPNETIIP